MISNLLLPALLAFQEGAADRGELQKSWKVSEEAGSFLFPPQASTVAPIIDSDYYMIQNWSIFFSAIIFFVLFYFMWKYNRKKHPKAERTSTHNTALELLWSVPPGFVLVYMFWRGFVGYIDLRDAPQDSYQITVNAMKWNWSFVYPNGVQSAELHVPVGRPTTLTMTSSDVLHSCFIPAFRTKMDVVPGRFTKKWFTPTMTGQFLLFCTEYCGTQHSDMLAKVFVHTEEDFQKWLEEEANWLPKMKYLDVARTQVNPDYKPEVAGKRVFESIGCTSCHRPDTAKLIGPGLGGVYESMVTLADGRTIKADEAFLRRSIEEPNVEIVAGYQPQMPSYKGQLQPDYFEALLAYIKSLKDVK
jgi:cytochrome c oxidase subunit II